MDKHDAISSMIRQDGLGLEIGPSFNPLFPKREGYRVKVLDHAPKEVLVRKYREHGMPQEQIDRIEDVDYVWSGEPLPELVGEDRFDYVVASHVIEHTPDIIAFLNECRQILAPGGVVCLVVPDKRFCFDRFRPLSSLGQVVDAHVLPRKEGVLAPLLDGLAYGANRFGTEVTWSAATTDGPQLTTKDWGELHRWIELVQRTDNYIDIHRWTFTPSSFRLLMDDLRQLAMVQLAISTITDTNHFEFYVGLRDTGAEPAESRTPDAAERLAELLAVEQELMDQAEGGGSLAMRRELVDLRAQVADMQASTSWRVTKPLRRLGAWRQARHARRLS